VRNGAKSKFDNGQKYRRFMPFRVNSIISVVGPKSSCEIAKYHRLDKMTVWQRELKKIRGKDEMAIVVTAPGTVDDVDTTELNTLGLS
jgi:hypothetical protein